MTDVKADVRIERQPDEKHLGELCVREWPVWTKETSIFPWSYNSNETCYFLEGEVIVIPDDGGKPLKMGKGDLVTFPKGMSCTWKILKNVRKHYRFD